MPRKGHTKSRGGCKECKERHVKCDESHPVCQRCASSRRACSFASSATGSLQRASVNESLTSRSRLALSASDHSSQTSGDHFQAIPRSSAALVPAGLTPDGLLHLELFYNFEHETSRTFTHTEEHIEVYRRVMLNRVFKSPYLMQAALGLSALQLSLVPSERVSTLQHAAAVLQSQALQTFHATDVLQDVNEDNVLDLLLFQHLIALQVFCDIFSRPETGFSDFIEKLVGCIHLLRGLESVTDPWHRILSHSDLGVVIQTAEVHQKSPHNSLSECKPLVSLLDKADLSARSIEVCRTSVDRLQSYFDAENNLKDEPINSTHMLFAWLVTASNEYTNLLAQRRPEALIILAYFAVLLFRRRRNWVVGSAGQKLLQYIRDYLGSTWEEHLQWPISEMLG